MKRLVFLGAAIAALGLMATTVFADNAHLVKAKASLSGQTVTITAKYAGLGSGQTYFGSVSGNVSVSWTCTNKGTHVVEPHSGTASVSGSATGTATRAGTLTLTYFLTFSPQIECPSHTWTLDITSVSGTVFLNLTGPGVNLSDPFFFSLP